jgi:hypothetical protein
MSICVSHIPKPHQLCVDGGLTDFQPIVDTRTLTVSPFYFNDADIVPSRYVPLWWGLFPPGNTDTIDWLYALGQKDAHDYLAARLGDKAFREFSVDSPARGAGVGHARGRHRYDSPRTVSIHRLFG